MSHGFRSDLDRVLESQCSQRHFSRYHASRETNEERKRRKDREVEEHRRTTKDQGRDRGNGHENRKSLIEREDSSKKLKKDQGQEPAPQLLSSPGITISISGIMNSSTHAALTASLPVSRCAPYILSTGPPHLQAAFPNFFLRGFVFSKPNLKLVHAESYSPHLHAI